MEYYILAQDHRYRRIPVIDNFQKYVQRKDMKENNAANIPDINSAITTSKLSYEYIDIIDNQIFLVSKLVKTVFHCYEPNMIFKMFCLMNPLTREVGEYYAPIFRDVDCIDKSSEITNGGCIIRRLVLKQCLIDDNAIFRIIGVNKEVIIVRLDVAESLLRRKLQGLNFTGVEVV